MIARADGVDVPGPVKYFLVGSPAAASFFGGRAAPMMGDKFGLVCSAFQNINLAKT
jgi:hypothetical protein